MSALLIGKTLVDHFPPPEFLTLSTAGISITDDSIKFAQLRKGLGGGELKLEHRSRSKSANTSDEPGVINDVASLTSALKEVSSHQGIHFIRATLPEEKAYIFTTSIDKAPADTLYDAVAFIVEENVPIALSEAVFHFEVLGEEKDGTKIKIAVTVLPKSVVDAYIDVFESAGLTPISFDTESQAIARAVVPKGDKRPYLIVNLSQKKTGFYIVDDEVVQFTTTPSYGIGENGSEENLENLKAEMRKVVAFWGARLSGEHPEENKIAKILVTGAGASKKDFVNKMMSEVGIEYEIANIGVNAPKMDEKSLDSVDVSLGYAPAIGLILAS